MTFNVTVSALSKWEWIARHSVDLQLYIARQTNNENKFPFFFCFSLSLFFLFCLSDINGLHNTRNNMFWFSRVYLHNVTSQWKIHVTLSLRYSYTEIIGKNLQISLRNVSLCNNFLCFAFSPRIVLSLTKILWKNKSENLQQIFFKVFKQTNQIN